MKYSRLLVALLLTCASISCLLLKTDERIDVIVAATNLEAGTKITDKDITISSIPVSKMTQDMPRKSSQVVGRTTKVRISKGEQVLLSEMK
jgi:flagella basal body P-ring formation protein FlgA